jgi:hypothetical protein
MFSRAVLLLLATHFAFAQSTIQGVVNDDTGKSPSGIYVVATAQSPTDHRTYSTLTGPKGEYSFSNLPAGSYTLCVQAPGGSHLGNCTWNTPTTVALASSQTLVRNLSVTQGGTLQIRLDDPNHLATPADDLLIGVFLPTGLFHPMRLASTDATGRTYDVAVPLNSPVRLTIISTHLQINDDKGKDLAPQSKAASGPTPTTSSTITIAGPQAAKGPPITFTITGRK